MLITWYESLSRKEHSKAAISGILWAYDYPKMKCPLTPDCSRAGGVPATQRNPALFSTPDPTHYREYIYYHMTTPYQPSQEAQDFGRSTPDPYPIDLE